MINLAITLVLLFFFANLSLQQTDILKQDLQSFVLKQSNITLEEYNQLQELCAQDSNLGGCEFFTQNPIDKFGNEINSLKNYYAGGIFIVIALFILGIILIYLSTGNFLEAMYKINLNLTIQSFFAAFYYKIIPSILTTLPETSYFTQLASEVPKETIYEIINIILAWLQLPLIKTFELALILGIIFLVITIILHILKKKKSKTLKVINKQG